MNKPTTFMLQPGQVERKWYVVDATDVPLGRLSAVVAGVLTPGKNKPTFTPRWLQVTSLCVINAEKLKLTGKKATVKSTRSTQCIRWLRANYNRANFVQMLFSD